MIASTPACMRQICCKCIIDKCAFSNFDFSHQSPIITIEDSVVDSTNAYNLPPPHPDDVILKGEYDVSLLRQIAMHRCIGAGIIHILHELCH